MILDLARLARELLDIGPDASIVDHREAWLAFKDACSPDVILKLCAVVEALRDIEINCPPLRAALAALTPAPTPGPMPRHAESGATPGTSSVGIGCAGPIRMTPETLARMREEVMNVKNGMTYNRHVIAAMDRILTLLDVLFDALTTAPQQEEPRNWVTHEEYHRVRQAGCPACYPTPPIPEQYQSIRGIDPDYTTTPPPPEPEGELVETVEQMLMSHANLYRLAFGEDADPERDIVRRRAIAALARARGK